MMSMGLAVVLAAGIAVGNRTPDDRRLALAHYRSGEELMRSEQYEEAVREFGRAVERDPLLLIARYNLGYSLMALKRYAEAAHAYEACVDTVEAINSSSSRERDQLERQRQDEVHNLKEALNAVQSNKIKGAQVGPESLRIEERIRVLEQLSFADRVQTRTPPEVYLGLGSAYFRQSAFPEAERAYLQAVREDKKMGAAHNNLAVLYMLSGRLSQAQEALQSAERAGFRVDPRLKADLTARNGN
jgi:Flp pilus assembly protein TadD